MGVKSTQYDTIILFVIDNHTGNGSGSLECLFVSALWYEYNWGISTLVFRAASLSNDDPREMTWA
jgi:hypothetical protein